jgi:hypothetical protein
MSRSATASGPSPEVACTLGAADLGAQRERWMILYTEAATARVATDDGVRISFRWNPVVEAQLRALVAVEAECCSWAKWAVEVAGEQLVLEIRSVGEGVRVVQSWFSDA